METRRAGGVTGEADDGGDYWVLNGAKRWIGNGTFCDYLLVWARDEAGGAVRGFIVDASLPGVTPEPGSRTRSPCAPCRTRTSCSRTCRVAEADRFAGIGSFEDTNELLRGSRIMVAWQAVGSSWRRSTSPGSTPSNASSSAGRWRGSSSSSSSW